MSPAQELVSARLKLICDEVAATLGDLHFDNLADWAKAFDVAERFIKWRMLQDVANGAWVEAGIPADVDYLDDLTIHVGVNDAKDGVHMGIKMPRVMQILREQDDPNVN